MESIEEALRRAERLMTSRNYQDAHRECLSVLKVDPTQWRAWFLLGVLAADYSNYARAIELLEKAALLNVAAPEPLVQLARCKVATNRQAQAVELAERAAAMAPQDALSLDTLGVVFTRAGLHERAIEFFEQAAAREPHNASFQYNLAAARQFAGRFHAAEHAYGAAQDQDPDR